MYINTYTYTHTHTHTYIGIYTYIYTHIYLVVRGSACFVGIFHLLLSVVLVLSLRHLLVSLDALTRRQVAAMHGEV